MKMKDSGVEWIGEIPEGWEIGAVKKFYRMQTGFTPDTKNDTYYSDDEIEWLTISDLTGEYNIPKETKSHISHKYVNEFKPQTVPAGSLLYSFKLSVGQTAFTDRDIYTNEAIAAFLNSDNVNLKFLYYSSLFIIENANENIYGAKLLNQKLINNAKIIFPPKETQEKIANYLDEKCSQIEQTIQNQQQVIEKLKAYKQSLITEVVTGKVKIQNGKVAGKYEQYKDSGLEWIGEIPSGWEVAKLKNLYKFLGGFAFNSDDYIEDSNNQILRIGNVKDFKILFDASPVYISNELAEKVDNFRLKPGYILFTMTGTRGKKDYFYTHEVNKNDCLKKNIFLNQRVGCLIPIANICSSYFNYLLKEKLIKDSVFLTETGTANQANIGSEDVMKTKVHLPPKEEQKSIVKYLDKTYDTIDSAIEKKQKLIEKLTEYKKSLIYECVTGKKEI